MPGSPKWSPRASRNFVISANQRSKIVVQSISSPISSVCANRVSSFLIGLRNATSALKQFGISILHEIPNLVDHLEHEWIRLSQ